MEIKDFTVKVLEKNQLTPHVVEVICESGGLVWQPGQYVSVVVGQNQNPDGSKVSIRRSYSIFTTPDFGKVGFVVDTKPMGPGSQYFINLKVGEQISFKGPLGKFTLSSALQKQIVFVATGTGIGPLRAMIDDLFQNTKNLVSETKVELYFGFRTQEDIFWRDYFEKLQEKHPEKFVIKIVLSQPGQGWIGLTGHVTEHVVLSININSKPEFYLCGNLNMISDVSEKLKGQGISTNFIHFESYYGDSPAT